MLVLPFACLCLPVQLLLHCDEVYTPFIVSIIGELIEVHATDMQSTDGGKSMESRIALNQYIIRIVSSFVQVCFPEHSCKILLYYSFRAFPCRRVEVGFGVILRWQSEPSNRRSM